MSRTSTSKGKSKKINLLKTFNKTRLLFNKIRILDSIFETMILKRNERIAKRFENSSIRRDFNILL